MNSPSPSLSPSPSPSPFEENKIPHHTPIIPNYLQIDLRFPHHTPITWNISHCHSLSSQSDSRSVSGVLCLFSSSLCCYVLMCVFVFSFFISSSSGCFCHSSFSFLFPILTFLSGGWFSWEFFWWLSWWLSSSWHFS